MDRTMQGMGRPALWVVVTVICWVSRPALGADGPSEGASARTGPESPVSEKSSRVPSEKTIGVAVLSDGPAVASTVETLLGLLDARGYAVVAPGALRRRIRQRRVAAPKSSVTDQFSNLSRRVGAGIERFFYKSRREALSTLTPIVNVGLAHPNVLARRPDFADQIYQAAIVMMRAYRHQGNGEDARRLGRSLIETFPAREHQDDTAPPEIRRILAEQAQAVAAQGSEVTVQTHYRSGCTGYLNGNAVSDGQRVALAAGEPSYWMVECGGPAPPVRRLTLEAGQTRSVPLIAGRATGFRMKDTGFEARKAAEKRLEVMGFWAGVDTVLGVAAGDGEGGDARVVLVRKPVGGAAAWSDRAEPGTVDRLLAKVLPGYDGPAARGAGRDAGSGRAGRDGAGRWLSWTLVGGAAASVGLSTWGLVAARRRSGRLACSARGGRNPGSARCSGYEPLEFGSEQAFEEAKGQVRRVHVVSAVGLGVGVGLASWGIWRLAVRGREGQAGRRTKGRAKLNASIGWMRGGGMIRIGGSF